MRLKAVVTAIFRGGAPSGLFIFVSANDSIEVTVAIRCRPSEIFSEPPLFFQVSQHDVSLLGVARVTGRVRSVRVMSGELILRGMSEQPLSKPNEPLLPTLGVIQILCDSELLRLVGSLFSSSSPPTHEDNQEDESTSKSHEKDLPPLEFVRINLGGSRRVEPSDTRQRWHGCRSRGLWDLDQLGQANA